MQTFQFKLSISRLPRYAKLCLAVHSGSKQVPLFWVNTNVFDYKAKMKGTSTLHMWPYTQVLQHQLQGDHGCLTLHFLDFDLVCFSCLVLEKKGTLKPKSTLSSLKLPIFH